MATNKSNTAETRRIVDDLMSKYPRGPKNRFARSHYVECSEWSEAYRRHRPSHKLNPDLIGVGGLTELTVQHWGYEPMQLFKLGARGEDSSKELIKSLYTGLKGPGITRRGRLLWSRVKHAVKYVYQTGGEGIWSVQSHSADYGSLWRDMKIWGASKEDVEARVRLIGPMTGLAPEWRLDIKFHDVGTPDDATQFAVTQANMKVNRLRRSIESYRKQLAAAETELEEELKNAAQSMGGIMLLSGDQNEEQEASQ